MGSVGTRKDGRVFVKLPKDLDPKQRPKYGPGKRQRFASEEAATVWLDAAIVKARTPNALASRKVEPLGVYLVRYLGMFKDEWPERTYDAYRNRVKMWAPIAHVLIGDLTREVVQHGISEMANLTWIRLKKDGTPHRGAVPKPYSRTSISQARMFLHQALELLVPDVLSYNPARQRRARRMPDPPQPVWAADQVDHVIATANRIVPEHAIGIRLVLRRALRRGEVIDLKWTDADERNGVLVVDETAGKRFGESGPPKSRRVRDVPMTAAWFRDLREHRRKYGSTSPHILSVNGRRMSLGTFNAIWRRVVRAAGVPYITPKDGRATCATILLDEGRPLPVVAQLLGHASVATTARFYARVIKRRAEQQAQLGEDIDAAMRRASERAAEDAPTPLRGSESGS
jgi:integrase